MNKKWTKGEKEPFCFTDVTAEDSFGIDSLGPGQSKTDGFPDSWWSNYSPILKGPSFVGLGLVASSSTVDIIMKQT